MDDDVTPAASADVVVDEGRPAGEPRRAAGVEALYPLAVRAFALDGPGDHRTLHPAEAGAVAGARSGRRREFAAGRACARAALAAWGTTPRPLLPGPDRGPRWPLGIRGSISHTRGYAVAVVAEPPGPRTVGGGAPPAGSGPGAGIGVDAERVGRVTPELHRRLFTASERAWLTTLSPPGQAALVTAAFAAKEAFYKAQHPITASWVGFRDVAVQPSSPGRLELAPASDLPALDGWEWPVEARYLVDGDLVVVGVTACLRPPR